jgi:prepilin-type N-terminal cleavage/methylation domain-containing protein
MHRLLRNERGFTFIEVIISVALVGIIAGGFLSALAVSSHNTEISDERTTAESLARTEMEYVRNSVYVMARWEYNLPDTRPSWDASHALPAGAEGYSIHVAASPLRMIDDGIQSIIVTVSHGGGVVFSLEDYKVIRGSG